MLGSPSRCDCVAVCAGKHLDVIKKKKVLFCFVWDSKRRRRFVSTELFTMKENEMPPWSDSCPDFLFIFLFSLFPLRISRVYSFSFYLTLSVSLVSSPAPPDWLKLFPLRWLATWVPVFVCLGSHLSLISSISLWLALSILALTR